MSNYTQYRVLYKEQAREAAEALATEIAECGCLREPGPRHARAYFMNGVFYNGGCASGSAWYDPTIKMFVGRSHCSCDGCY